MSQDETRGPAHLHHETSELARANEDLRRELAQQRLVLQTLEAKAQRLESLGGVSWDWSWEQDASYRFTEFALQEGSPVAAPLIEEGLGLCRWDLPGTTPLGMSWDAHRAMLEARQPFRNFEYRRELSGRPPGYFSSSGVPVFGSGNEFLGYQGTTRDISASRLSEAEQKNSRFLDEVLDNIPIAFNLKSVRDGYDHVAWNKAAEALVGLTRDEVMGRSLHDIWPSGDADRMHKADMVAVQSGVSLDFPDSPVMTKHRGVIRVHMRKVPLKDASGTVTHLLSTAEDITERLATEARLRQSKARFRSLTRLSSDWYWELDEQFRFTQVSSGVTDLDRLPGTVAERIALSERLGKTRWDIDRNPRNAAVWTAHRAQLEKYETFRDVEYERLDKDGQVFVFCISGEPIWDGGGRFAGYRGVGNDITLRKQTDRALQASDALFRSAVAALAEGVIVRDAEDRVIDCNASAERIMGKTLAQMRGRTIVAPEWRMLSEDGSPVPEEERPTAMARRTGLPHSNRVVCYCKPDGSTLWALINVQPLFEDGTATPTGLVTSITDISKRKRAEMEIVRLNVDLESRVQRRTAQLAAANKELEAFSYSVAHDLRSPLSSIDGYSALLQKALPPDAGERVRHFLGRIRAGVQHMGELTDGLLALAQLSRTSLNWNTVDLSAEATRIVRHCAEQDASRVLQATIEPGLLVRADRSLLRQVLENLLANAWKFSAKKPQTEIFVGKELDAHQQPVYVVRDKGAGFDMAYMDKLFGTFQRLHSPEEFSGSGIGLATVKRIITRHGGRIWAESAPGEGSSFYFTLGSDVGQAALKADERRGESGIALAQVPRAHQLFLSQADAPAGSPAGPPLSSDNDAFTMDDRQFSHAFEHAAIGMVLVFVGSERLRVNSAFCKMLGYSEAEMLSRTVRDVTHPDDIAFDVLHRKRALAGEIETFQWEKRYIHQSGRIVWAHRSCSLVRDADRKPLYFISQVQDITERKQTERVLRESEERFRALTELSSDWFWEQDENYRFTQVTGRVVNVAGIEAHVIGKTRWELYNLQMNDSLWEAHRAQLLRREVFRDFEIVRFDDHGQAHYESISGVPVFDASGRFTGYRGTGRDTTEMRRVNAALRASETQLRDVTDTVQALISYVDADQRFHFHNRAYAESLGLSHAQIHGRLMHDVLGEAGYELVRPHVEEVLTGYPVVFNRARKNPNGDMRDFVVNYFPRYGDGATEGQVVGFYSLATDVTELKRIDRMKSEFVSTVSHELRTPLTSIRGSLGLISGGVAGALPEGVKTLVGIAKNNCERLIRLVNDILDIEKIESGKINLDLRAMELKPLLAQVLAEGGAYAAEQQVGLSLLCPEDTLQVHGDSDRLVQDMTNLLSNALKFSPPGQTVQVQATRQGARVRVDVRDRGPGISEEFRKRIFQKFSQADSSDTRQKGGTGLGLYISRAVIERLGGSIGFESEVGVGSTFFFELPEWKALPALPPVVVPEGACRPRILVCEDDHDIARLIGMMLDKGGFDTDLAYSAAQATAYLAQANYAAMTVDLRLPDQDGITLIRHLRRQMATRDLPIVVVSAMAGEKQIQFNNQRLSVSDWLEKPIDENLLIRGLRRAIDGAGGKPRILHVEDDFDIQRITAAIAQDFAIFEFAATLQEARARLREQRFALVLLDLTLQEDSGWDLVADIEALSPAPPVVVFSATEIEPTERARAAALLVKAQTSNDELLQTLQRVLSQAHAPPA